MSDVPWSCSTNSCVQWRVLPGGEVQLRQKADGPVLVFWTSEVDDFVQQWQDRNVIADLVKAGKIGYSGSGVPAPVLTRP